VIAGWGLEEKEITDNLQHYFEHLPGHLRHSFAPIPVLLDQLMSCYDPHLLVYKTVKSPSMSGLIAFNVDTMVQKQTEKQTRVNLYHLSALIDDESFPGFVDEALNYVWKHMHCSVIRLSLYHYAEDDHAGKL
jgi:hypothetical protein